MLIGILTWDHVRLEDRIEKRIEERSDERSSSRTGEPAVRRCCCLAPTVILQDCLDCLHGSHDNCSLVSRFRQKPVEIVEMGVDNSRCEKPMEVDSTDGLPALTYDGTWPPVMAFLDECAGGRMSIPFGSRPPVTRLKDATLVVHNRDGMVTAQPGDQMVFRKATGDFIVLSPTGD